MQDFQDRGESYRQELGIDGTAGDAQDVPHPYKPDGENKWCLACGLAEKASIHDEPMSEAEQKSMSSYSIVVKKIESSRHYGLRYEITVSLCADNSIIDRGWTYTRWGTHWKAKKLIKKYQLPEEKEKVVEEYEL